MNTVELIHDDNIAPIIVEEQAYEGIKLIAGCSADDFELVTGKRPKIINEVQGETDFAIIYATVGKSNILDELEKKGKINTANVRGKWEVYGIRLVEEPLDGIKTALVIYGSDKRGTIYGIFHLSEHIGVSPLVFWGDAKPICKEQITFDKSIEITSKEPSVQYRGFFINDEWPCFGNWTFSHYGGFTAKMYKHVFELLLRLKGNYMWPAMWSSSFALDGPGEESAKLADCYGVIIGNSHHEPCLRAGEEWDIYKGDDTPYGTKWNYVANKNGLIEYWKDGLIRSSKYDSIVTVGMRGERDSIMEGTNSLKENIDVLKDIITSQQNLLEKYADTKDRKLPRLLAIYKEVEEYFYGSDEAEGLRTWEGLSDIILMFCEDNFGNMRALPDEAMQKHKAGFGMYYHLDYHGSPVSYEWVNSTPLSKIWEQMTQAYECGVRKVWIVNVGDLKGNEFPLSYFLDLAYDYDKWGINAPNMTRDYTRQWMDMQFGSAVSETQKDELTDLLTQCIHINSLCRPEVQKSNTYHPAHYGEADYMIKKAIELTKRASNLKRELPEISQSAYYSMILYPLLSSMNLLLMNTYAGKNEHYARQGKVIANEYADKVTKTIKRDRELASEFAAAFDGKWRGMEREAHVGFNKWNEDGCRYPLRMIVEPYEKPRMVVSRSDDERIAVKNYGKPECIECNDFLYPDTEEIIIEVANDGIGSFDCRVENGSCEWLNLEWNNKTVEKQETLRITCNKDKLDETVKTHSIMITDGETTVEIKIHAKAHDLTKLPNMTFVSHDGIIAINAEHFAASNPCGQSEWKVIRDYGKSGAALKAFPVTKSFEAGKGPNVTYLMDVDEGGEYIFEIWTAATNPVSVNDRLRLALSVNDAHADVIATVGENYCAGNPDCMEWCEGVLTQVHKTKIGIKLTKGVNRLTVYAMEPEVLLERFFVYKQENPPVSSYLGHEECLYIK